MMGLNKLGVASLLAMVGCMPPPGDSPNTDLGIAWVRDAAEYRAASLQAYGMAATALDEKLSDTSWSALPGQLDAAALRLQSFSTSMRQQ